MPWARMIGMGVGDNGPLHRAKRVDIKLAWGAKQAFGADGQKMARVHSTHLGEEGRKTFFFEKKKQKTFDCCRGPIP
jgi:hypothetical protein